MIVLALIQWWYGRGWAEQGRAFFRRIDAVANNFSLGILFKTWFSPWKQIVSYTGRDSSLDSRFRASIDNFVSRVVGFFVRTIVMATALASMCAMGVAGASLMVVWPVIPLLPVVLALLSAGVKPW